MPQSLDEWIEEYRMAWENMDADAAAALFTADAIYRDNIFEDPHRGKEGVRSYWESVTAPQSDVRVLMGRPFVDGSRVAVEFWATMKYAGEETTLPGCLLLEFDDKWQCRALREYWVTAEGLVEPPTVWGQ